MGHDWEWHEGDSPLVATAIHAGHELSPPFAEATALSEAERLHEEDPYSDAWTAIAPTRIMLRRSRFEVDLNRPIGEAVYRSGEDAWGGELWRSEITPD